MGYSINRWEITVYEFNGVFCFCLHLWPLDTWQSMTIEIVRKTVYGNERFYPVNETAKALAGLMKRDTFNRSELKQIKEMGIEIKQVVENIEI